MASREEQLQSMMSRQLMELHKSGKGSGLTANQQPVRQQRRADTSSSRQPNRKHSKERRHGNDKGLSVFEQAESRSSSTHRSSGHPAASGGNQSARGPRNFGSHSRPASGHKEPPEANVQGKPRGQRDGQQGRHPHQGRHPQHVQNRSTPVPVKDMFQRRDQSEHRRRNPKHYGSQPNLLDCFRESSTENETQKQQKPQGQRDKHRGRYPQQVQNMSTTSTKIRFERRDQSEHQRRNLKLHGSQSNLFDCFRESSVENETQRQQEPRGRQPFRGMGRENPQTTHESHSQTRCNRPGSQTRVNQRQYNFTQNCRTNQKPCSRPTVAESSNPVYYKQWRLDSRELGRLAVMDPADVIMKLAAPRSGLKEFLNQANPDRNLIVSFLKVLSSVFQCKSNRQNLHYVLELIKDSMFLKNILPTFVISAKTEVLPEAHLESSAHLASTIKLLCELITVYPASAFLDVSVLAALVQTTSNYLQSIGIAVSTETEKGLQNLHLKVAILLEKKRDGTLTSDTYTYFTGPEVEDFRRIPIYPTYDDIHLINKPYVRPNIVTGKYPDTATYLDIHFRLLREDFVRPLRDGISKLLTYDQKDLKKKQIDDIRIYFDVHILGPLCTRSGVFYRVQFNINLLKFVRWESSKRLLFGSFLCLSKDNFETMLFATVAHRSIEELKDGIIILSFTEESHHQLVDIKSMDSFLMVETTAYFEAYRHVLEGLKEIKDHELPFQKYIVQCQTHVAEPKYLTYGYQNYTLEPLMKENALSTPKKSSRSLISNSSPHFNLSLLGNRDFNVRNLGTWPSKEKLSFDESQMQALQTALTKELAIIQGPPGTGKTFMGLKAVEILLANTNIWQYAGSSPILVVCYTNHALDQFLEGIHKFLDTGLVRVGGRSNSKTLSKFSMQVLRKQPNFKKNLPGYLKGAYSTLIDERQEIQKTIEMLAASLEASEKGVLQMYTLSQYIALKHLESLQVGMVSSEDGSSSRSNMLEWLGITFAHRCYFTSEGTPEKSTEEDTEETSSNATEEDTGSPSDLTEEEKQMEDDDELIQVAEEAEPLQMERMIGDNDLQKQVQSANARLLTNQEQLHYFNLKETVNPSKTQVESDDDDDWQVASEGTPASRSNMPRYYFTSKGAPEQTTEEDMEETDSNATKGDTGSSSDLTEEEDEEEDQQMEDGDELIRVTEEAELLQAERMIGDDDLQKQFRSADARLAAIQEQFLAFKPEETVHCSKTQAECEDDGDWQVTRNMKKKMQTMVKKQLKLTDCMSEDEANSIVNVWELARLDRWRLYRLWLSKYQTDTRCGILRNEELYQKIVNRLAELRNQEEMILLRQSKVVGMTTTGAAKYRPVLQDIRPKIVIVEEAAEVLEAHIITTLSSACEHLILIGDHQQLRPSATVYELATRFNLDVSLFERLINMNVHYVRLDYQHRMRPEIAKLLTPHIYDKLENSESVKLYEKIKGVSTNLYFIDHMMLENVTKEGKSFHNPHEANFVKSLCEYFIQQEYKPSQITILTTYSGQLLYLRKMMPKKRFNGVEVCVVDKYQGEENDIVILSLVRSNLNGVVGFLRIPNRICVALSRAKKGFYCIGNMSMLSSKVPLWGEIVDWLRRNGKIGPTLQLCCQNHPGNSILVSAAEDFRQAPEGGCSLPCNFRLKCGHTCTSACHHYDPEHEQYKCLAPCQVLCKEGHRCPHLCSEPCGKCNVKAIKVLPQCGHEQEMPCSFPPEKFHCQAPCSKTIECGHRCMRRCRESCTRKCPAKFKVMLRCGHERQVSCHLKKEAELTSAALLCHVPCLTQLACGHYCKASCFECASGRLHVPCDSACGQRLICCHTCSECCSGECPPCTRACENQCPHGKCLKTCGELCVPCMQPCEWACPHSKCTMLCHEPCKRKPCDRPCNQSLQCGHPCIGLCGEPCPSKCRVCHEDDVTEIFFGREDDPKTRFIQLEDCHHIFAVSGFDDWMQQSKVDGSVAKLSLCPKCSTPIRRNVRYGSIIKSTLAEIEKAKAKILGDEEELKRYKKSLEQFLEAKKELSDYYLTEILDLQLQLQEPNISTHKLVVLRHKISFLSKIAELKSKGNKLLEEQRMKIQKETELQAKWIMRSRVQFTDQELSDIEREISKLTQLNDIYLIQNAMQKQRKLFDLASQLTIKELLHVLEDGKADCDEKWLHESVDRLKMKYPLTRGNC